VITIVFSIGFHIVIIMVLVHDEIRTGSSFVLCCHGNSR